MLTIIKKIINFSLPNWLVGVMILVLVLRIPSFFEPYSYGDEMIYLTLGEAIRQGLVLYRDIHDNKPPLLYLLAAIAGNVFWFRVILAMWNMVYIVLFWQLTKKIFPKNTKAQKVGTTVLAILSTIPLFEGQIANSEVFMIGFSILAFLILLSDKLTAPKVVAAGIFFSLATLFKVPAAFEVPVVVVLWFFKTNRNLKEVVKLGKKTALLSLGFATPLVLTFVWYYLRGGLSQYISAAFVQNVGYLSSWRPDASQESFLAKNAPLMTRSLIVLIGLSVLYLFRKKLSLTFTLASVWLLFTLFAVTLSERPYPHYLIQTVPALSILIAILATSTTKEQVYSIIPLTLFALVPFYFKFWYYSSSNYYNRFLEFATSKVTVDEYFKKFDSKIPSYYEIAKFITSITNSKDKIFVWGDTSTIYALAKRLPPIKYVADYHVKDFYSPETALIDLGNNPPKMVVVLPQAEDFKQLDSFLKRNYIKIKTLQEAEIWYLQQSRGKIH